MTDTQIERMTQEQGENIAKLQAQFTAFTDHVHGEHSAMMERVEVRIKSVEDRQKKSEEKHKLIDELRISMGQFSEQLKMLNTNVSSLTSMLTDQHDNMRERIVRLEHDNDTLKQTVNDMQTSKKGVHAQLWGIVCSIVAGVGTALIMIAVNGGIG